MVLVNGYMTETDIRVVLGENIKRYRNFRGLSQAKLAELLDISPNFISELETGKRWLSSDTLVNLAEALDIDAADLLRKPGGFLTPEQAVADDISMFILNYTEKASLSVTKAVNSALADLRKQYV
jgi:transcriptional regulator with XRE-family HTH domain